MGWTRFGRSRRSSEDNITKKKIKQSHYRPGEVRRVLRKLKFPDFVTKAQNVGRLSALRTGRLYPPRNTIGTHFC